MKKITFTCAMIAFMMTNLLAQSNSQLSIQGVLRNANGTAVENGKYDIVFRLWDAPTNGTKVWEEEILQVDVEGGIYSVVLGQASTPLDASFTEQYFLSVSVEGGTELIPRAALTSSPYALSLIGSDNVFPNSGNVGVGSDDPQSKLTVSRENAVLGLDAEEGATNNATITSKADGLEFSTDGINNAYYFAGEMTEVMRIKKDGKVGIGTAAPQNTLHIVGDNEQIKVEGTDNANIVFTKTSGSATLGFDAAGGDDLKLINPIGDTQIEGDNVTFLPLGGTVNVEGQAQFNNDGEALKLVGTNSSYLSFYPQGNTVGIKGTLGFNDTANGNNLLLANTSSNGNLILKTNGGFVNVQDGLKVSATDYHTHFQGWYSYYVYNHYSNYNGGSGSSPSILATSYIASTEYRAYSDQRIKENLKLTNGASDLANLKKIEVTDYQHIDKIANGLDYKKGFIAQQVKEVFPEAVSQSKGHLPNLFCAPTKVKSDGKAYQITLHQRHQLKEGDKVRVIGKGNVEENLTVLKTIDDFTFTVAPEDISISEEVLIYGKEVDDFHTVDYDRVFTLNVSATQELARKVEALEKENAQLKSNATKTNDILKSLSAKVDALQQNIEMTGQK